METFILYFAATGMVIGALMLLGSLGSLLYVLFFRRKGNPTTSSGTRIASGNQSGHGQV